MAVLTTLVYLALQTRQNTMAIAAQLDATAIAGTHNGMLAAATSGELGEAIWEDMRDDDTNDDRPNQVRLGQYWASVFTIMQWQLHQSRRGLHPSFHEALNGGVVRIFLRAPAASRAGGKASEALCSSPSSSSGSRSNASRALKLVRQDSKGQCCSSGRPGTWRGPSAPGSGTA